MIYEQLQGCFAALSMTGSQIFRTFLRHGPHSAGPPGLSQRRFGTHVGNGWTIKLTPMGRCPRLLTSCPCGAEPRPDESEASFDRVGLRLSLVNDSRRRKAADSRLLTLDSSKLLCLRQQDNELELGVRNVAGNVRRQVSSSLHGFPAGPGLIQAEILIIQLYGD